ncbi:hypothetical protein C0993_009247 [Termitomyces sp. T159_Od127]|nr:hypothetical protein C0993_009247 [Termitomyces sp. T159_Od127]
MSTPHGYPAYNFPASSPTLGWGNTSTPAQPTTLTPVMMIDPVLLSPVDVPLSREKVSRTAIVGQVTTLETKVITLEKEVATLKAKNRDLMEWKEKTNIEQKGEREKMARELAELKGELDGLKNEWKKVNVLAEDGNSGIESGTEDDGLNEEARLAVELSTAHANSNIFKALVRTQFIEAMGCPGKLTADVLPPYPRTTDEWPVRPGTEVKAIRFRWERPHTDPDNWAGLMLISHEIQENGKQTMPSATAAIEHVSKDDHEARIIQKFKDLAKEVRRAHAKKITSLDVGTVQDAKGAGSEGHKGEGNITVKKEEFTEAKKSMRQSRQKGLNKFYQALDAVPNPDQSIKYTLRIQGEPKDYKPPHANSIKNKAQRWMVRQEWLDLNPVNQACDKLLADSGQLWGDANDLEELEARQKRAREEKSEIWRKKLKVEEVKAKKVNVKEKGKRKRKRKGTGGSKGRL